MKRYIYFGANIFLRSMLNYLIHISFELGGVGQCHTSSPCVVRGERLSQYIFTVFCQILFLGWKSCRRIKPWKLWKLLVFPSTSYTFAFSGLVQSSSMTSPRKLMAMALPALTHVSPEQLSIPSPSPSPTMGLLKTVPVLACKSTFPLS